MKKNIEELKIIKTNSVELVLEIENDTFDQDAYSYNFFSQDMDNIKTVYLLAVMSKICCGYISFSYEKEHVIHITAVAVRPNYQRLGIATRLIEYMNRLLEDREGQLKFLTEVRVSNNASINLFKKHGFIHIRYIRNYYKFPEEDAIVLEWRKNEII